MMTEASSLWKVKGPIDRTLLFEGVFQVGDGDIGQKAPLQKFPHTHTSTE